MAAAWQAVRISRVTLALHGAVYALAAAIASGLFVASAYALAAAPGVVWPPLTAPALLALAAAAFCAALPVPRPAAFWKPYASLTKALQLIVLVWGAAGVVLYALLPLWAGQPGAGADPGRMAAMRTAVLAAAALLLGWAARWDRFRQAGWLVYPLLLLVAVKLVVEDFPRGRPVTLFIALAVCGGAFILAPRLARHAGSQAGA
jgi:hypothetical protein